MVGGFYLRGALAGYTLTRVEDKTPESLLARFPQRAPLRDILALFLRFYRAHATSQHHRSELYSTFNVYLPPLHCGL